MSSSAEVRATTAWKLCSLFVESSVGPLAWRTGSCANLVASNKSTSVSDAWAIAIALASASASSASASARTLAPFGDISASRYTSEEAGALIVFMGEPAVLWKAEGEGGASFIWCAGADKSTEAREDLLKKATWHELALLAAWS